MTGDALPAAVGAQDSTTDFDDTASADSNLDPVATPDAAPTSYRPTPQATSPAAPRVNDAMRVLSRMQTDLDLITEGKRAATYEEVDTAFDKAVMALGIKLPALAGDARPEAPLVRQAAPGDFGSDAGNGAATQGSGLGGARLHLASTGLLADVQPASNWSSPEAAADTFYARVQESPSRAGANPASAAGSAGKKKPVKVRAPAATLWPKLPDQRSAQLTRGWPIPGDHHFAVAGAKGTNKLTFSDGRYAPDGGYRGIDPKTKKLRKHKGIDIPATAKDPVSAAADGVVLQSSRQKDWGNFVAIRHPDGYVTLYAHLDTRAKLKPGQPVTRGMEIGTVGNTGNAQTKGTHLHFEVRVYNGDSTLAAGSRTVDPDAWIRGELHEP